MWSAPAADASSGLGHARTGASVAELDGGLARLDEKLTRALRRVRAAPAQTAICRLMIS